MDGIARSLGTSVLFLALAACSTSALGQNAKTPTDPKSMPQKKGPSVFQFTTGTDDLLTPGPNNAKTAPTPQPPALPEVDVRGLMTSILQAKLKMSAAEANDYFGAIIRFDESAPADAVAALADFLKAYPASPKAPEVLYRLAVLDAANGNPPKSRYEELVRDYPESAWAQLVLKAQLNDEEVYNLAKSLRDSVVGEKRAADGKIIERKPTEAKAACAALAASQARSQTKNAARAREVTYYLADVHRAIGEIGFADQTLSILSASTVDSKECPWARLARLRSPAPGQELKCLDELTLFDGVRNDGLRAFRDVYLACSEKLQGEDAVRFRFHYAQALCELGEGTKGQDLYREIVKDHPSSPWAGDALFWLAEFAFVKGQESEAKTLFRDMAQRFPKHPRAAAAARWHKSLDANDKAVDAVSQAMLASLAKWQNGDSQFWMRMSGGSAGKEKLTAEFAFRDSKHFRTEISYPGGGLVIVSSTKGAWLWDRNGPVREASKSLDFGNPWLKLYVDPTTNNLEFRSGTDGIKRGLEIVDPPVVAARLAEIAVKGWHFIDETPPTGSPAKRRIAFESPQSVSPEPRRIEVDLSPDGDILAARVVTFNAGVQFEIIADPIQLGRPIPDDRFAPLRPEGAKVLQVPEINAFMCFAPAMQMISDLSALYQKK